MEYVMVPVPEEHAEAVLTHLHWNIGKPAVVQRWDDASIAELYDRVDTTTRVLLVAVAMAALDEHELTVAEAADLIEVSDREIVGTIIELTHLNPVPGAPTFILMLKELPANDQGPTWGQRAIMPADGVAALVRAVHAARTADVPDS